MFFKRRNKEKPAEATDAPAAEKKETGAATGGGGPSAGAPGLAADTLRRTVDAASLGFKTTADLDPAEGLIGQERALAAIDFGLKMRASDFNIFVLGPPASGKSTAVSAHLAKVSQAADTPPDWVYVNNFEDPRRPRALRLPAGRAPALARDVAAALAELQSTLPAAFEAEDYRARRRAIDEEFRGSHEDALSAIHARAAEQNIAVMRTPLGFGMAPMHDGRVVKPEVFNQLPQAMRRDVETRVGALQAELEAVLAGAPAADKERRRQLAELNAETARHAIEAALDEVSQACADLPDVAAFLADVERDLVAHADLFLTPGANAKALLPQAEAGPAQDARFRRYMVNVVVTHAKDAGAPVVTEANPTLPALLGRVEHTPHASGLVTDFLLIRAGALHKANGGTLLIDARQVLAWPFAWDSLKRVIKGGEIRIDPPLPDTPGVAAMQTLEPEPIPLDVKVILFGAPEIYYLLEARDPDFAQLFKVQADFDETIASTPDNTGRYARLVASMVKTHGLKPIDAGGVARLIEEAGRIARDREKLTIELGRIADIAREADFWSKHAGREVTTADDVKRAIDERTRRADRIRDRAQELVQREILLVDTAGAKPGQVNGLSTVEAGGFRFGRAQRITARVHLGQGRVTDIEREAKLGGPLHSKGVMILWGYLAGTFAREVPLALAATLVLEQSYGAVEGDSASAAELFALISALADQPLRQDLAVTGSVNQWGEVQAVSGINEKIEGFFDVCRKRGLSGTQGVVIPDANRQHLMLREDVVEAVREGRFSVHAIKTADEGLTLMTGIEAGVRGADGRFGADTVNGRVDAKLRLFAERARAFGMGTDKPAGTQESRS